MMYTHRLVSIAAKECEKQDVGPMQVVQLLDAWGYAYDQVRLGYRKPTIGRVKKVAKLIEPQAALDFRLTPVTFATYVDPAVTPDSIPGAMERLIAALEDLEPVPEMVDMWIKAFLDIHPFADGNGRTAWVLRHWLLDNFSRPEPLPRYYGDN